VKHKRRRSLDEQGSEAFGNYCRNSCYTTSLWHLQRAGANCWAGPPNDNRVEEKQPDEAKSLTEVNKEL
jgi:hypothetical protein